MSYILEALKKSAGKRPPGPVPDLFTVQGPQPPESSRRPLLALAGAVAFVAVVAIGGWAWLGRRDTQPEAMPARPSAPPPLSSRVAPAAVVPATPIAAAPPVASAPAPPRAAAVPAPVKRPSPEGRRAVPATAPVVETGGLHPTPPAVPEPPAVAAPAPAVAEPPVAPTTPAPSLSGAQAPATPVSQAAAPAPVTAEAPPPVPSPSLPAPAAVDSAPAVPAPQEPPAADTPSAAPPSPDAPPADGRVVDIEALPPAVRTALGKFAVSGHVWSEEAGLRLLTVENRIVREGQEAAPGVRLEEITPDGAIFTSRGWRFRVGGF